jgi:anti-sigma regulatory factor (Ser/Thr protein kinase)
MRFVVKDQLRCEVHEPSQVLAARSAAVELAHRMGFGHTDSGKVALAVTEAGTNLVKHASHGELLMRGIGHAGDPGVEVLAIDRGPGIQDVARALRDGYSTAGSAGNGLGALSRIADQFDLYSLPGKGTVVWLTLWGGRTGNQEASVLDLGVVCQPRNGEDASGDQWGCASAEHRHVLAVVDGLGHGPDANKAARAAIEALGRNAAHGPGAVIQSMHEASRPTRGSAAGVCELDPRQAMCRFAGVGNIACVVVTGAATRHLVSHSGIVGHSVRKVQEFAAPWPSGSLLVMHSDGVASHWDLGAYPGLSARHPAVIAAVLYRDHSRGRDDVTVVVARQRSVRP